MTQEDTYKTITALSEGIYTEKRSKFIAIAIPVRTLEEVKQHLEVYQKKYYDARHVCYAYMLGHERKNFRANDNGEPSGTAGKPILGQINSNELTDILIIVVRYFGGIKLGAGGLVRAYASSVAENLENADIRVLETCVEYAVSVDYAGIDGAQKYFSSHACSLLDSVYGADVCFQVAVKKTEETDFIAGLVDFMQGKVKTERGREYYAPFKE